MLPPNNIWLGDKLISKLSIVASRQSSVFSILTWFFVNGIGHKIMELLDSASASEVDFPTIPFIISFDIP